MNDKTIFKLVCLSACCFTFVSCGQTSKGKNATLFFAYSTENLMQDWNYLLEKDEDGDPIEMNEPFLHRDYTMRFNCIRNEYEGTQLIIYADQYIDKFDFVLPDVTDGENIISKDNFTVAVEWYQDCYGTNEYESFAGRYPDALIPLENYKFRRMNHIDKGYNQGLYFNFFATKEMKPGTYTGIGKLTCDNQVYDIPFEVTIYNATMTDDVNQRSSYLIWYEQIQIGEKDNYRVEMQKQYYDYCLTKRITPDELPDSYQNTPSVFAESLYKYVANDSRVTGYRIPIPATSYTKERARNYLTAALEKNFAIREAGDLTTNLMEKLYFYIDDEPSAASYDKVRGHDKDLFDLKNELARKSEYQYYFGKYPDIKASLLKIQNIVTREYDPLLVATNERGGIQTWCPQYQHFQAKSERDNYRARQLNTSGDERDYGENVWWYGCMDPSSPFPSYHLDADLITSRVVRYMQYEYYVEGSVFWCVNYNSKFDGYTTTSRDVWNDCISWDNCAGDGYIFYPGVEFGVDGPIDTLRSESILAGNEEYEYLYFIDQKVNEYNQRNSTSYDCRTLMSKYFTKLYKDMKPYHDNEVFNQVRLDLLNLVQAFTINLNSGMAMLLME